MRYLIAATLLLTALPAAAQRLDAHRSVVPGDTENCNFPRAPAHLFLGKQWSGGGRHAMWEPPLSGPQGPGSPGFVIDLAPSSGGTIIKPFGIVVTDGAAFLDRVDSVRMSIDGVDIGIPLQFDENEITVFHPPRFPRPRDHAMWIIDWEQQARIGQQLNKAARVEIFMLDKEGTALALYRLDVSKLRSILALLERVGWSCTAPARK